MSGFQLAGWHVSEFAAVILGFLVLAFLICALRVFYGTAVLKDRVPEATMFVIVGLIIGVVLACVETEGSRTLIGVLELPSDVFLLLLVPIILFGAAYFLDKQRFFHNFLEIAVYAIVGTAINTALIGIMMYFTRHKFVLSDPGYSFSEIFSFASLISAVDPVSVMAVMEALHVNATLYNIAFGESSLNDGVAIVLYMLFKDLDSLISTDTDPGTIVGLGIAKFLIAVAGAVAVGTAVAFFFSLILKIAHRCPVTEPLLMLVAAYLSFQLADSMLFSGVISIMTCGLFLSWYARPNLDEASKTTFDTLVRTLSSCAESFLFFDMGVQIGLNIVGMAKDRTADYIFLVCGLCYTIIARAVGVVLLTAPLNVRRRKYGETITWRDQLIMIQAGLRGAISFSLCISLELADADRRSNLVFTTCIIILFTILVFGLPMGPALKGLKISREPETKPLEKLNVEEAAERLAIEAFLLPVTSIRVALEGAAGLHRAAHATARGLTRAHRALSGFYINHEVAEEHELAKILAQYTSAWVAANVRDEQQIADGLQDTADRVSLQTSIEQLREKPPAPYQYVPTLQFTMNRDFSGGPSGSGRPSLAPQGAGGAGGSARGPPGGSPSPAFSPSSSPLSPPGGFPGPAPADPMAGIDPAILQEAKYQRQLRMSRASNAESVMRRSLQAQPPAGPPAAGSRPDTPVGPAPAPRPPKAAILSIASHRRGSGVAPAGAAPPAPAPAVEVAEAVTDDDEAAERLADAAAAPGGVEGAEGRGAGGPEGAGAAGDAGGAAGGPGDAGEQDALDILGIPGLAEGDGVRREFSTSFGSGSA